MWEGSVWILMDPYGPVWSLGTPLGLPGALGGPERGVKGGSPPGGARGALLGGLPISLRGILTYMALWPAYGLSEDPGLTTYFFPGRDGVGGWGYPGESSSSTVLRGSRKLPEAARGSPREQKVRPLSAVLVPGEPKSSFYACFSTNFGLICATPKRN